MLQLLLFILAATFTPIPSATVGVDASVGPCAVSSNIIPSPGLAGTHSMTKLGGVPVVDGATVTVEIISLGLGVYEGISYIDYEDDDEGPIELPKQRIVIFGFLGEYIFTNPITGNDGVISEDPSTPGGHFSDLHRPDGTIIYRELVKIS